MHQDWQLQIASLTEQVQRLEAELALHKGKQSGEPTGPRGAKMQAWRASMSGDGSEADPKLPYTPPNRSGPGEPSDALMHVGSVRTKGRIMGSPKTTPRTSQDQSSGATPSELTHANSLARLFEGAEQNTRPAATAGGRPPRPPGSSVRPAGGALRAEDLSSDSDEESGPNGGRNGAAVTKQLRLATLRSDVMHAMVSPDLASRDSLCAGIVELIEQLEAAQLKNAELHLLVGFGPATMAVFFEGGNGSSLFCAGCQFLLRVRFALLAHRHLGSKERVGCGSSRICRLYGMPVSTILI